MLILEHRIEQKIILRWIMVAKPKSIAFVGAYGIGNDLRQPGSLRPANHRRADVLKRHLARQLHTDRVDELRGGVDHRLWLRRREFVAIAKDKVVFIISPDGTARHFVILPRVLSYLGSPSGCLH